MAKTKSEQGRFAYEGLDRVIHEKARLSVLTSLVAHPKGLVFGDLKQMCGLTDGNLSRHLQVLQEAGLVAIERATTRTGRRPSRASRRMGGRATSNTSKCSNRSCATPRAPRRARAPRPPSGN